MKIYLDMDGVLADFDAGSRLALGTDNPYKWEFVNGTKKFWDTLNADPNFWDDLPIMPGAYELLNFVADQDVSILTALPKEGDDWVRLKKTNWLRWNLSSSLPVITCLRAEKARYAKGGNILVDDRAVTGEEWIAAGGKFVLHTSWLSTKKQLRALGV